MSQIIVLKFFIYSILYITCSEIIHGKSNTIESLEITSQISKEGIVSISETRKMTFIGQYKFTYLKISKNLFEDIYDIRVTVDNNEYTIADSALANTFQIQNRKNSIIIKWYHYAKDTSKIFTVSYKLRGALRIGPNDVQFHWTYLGKEWDVNTKKLIVKQQFEEQLPKDNVWFMATGLDQSKLKLGYKKGIILLETAEVPLNKRIKMNTIFPIGFLTKPVFNDRHFSLERELEKIKNKELGTKFGPLVATLFIGLALIGLLTQFFRFGKEYKIENTFSEQKLSFPSSHHPALVSYFLTYQKLSGAAILATLFRLARNGNFLIQEEEVIKKSFFNKKGKKEKKVLVQIKDISGIKELVKWDHHLAKKIISEINFGKKYLDEIFAQIGSDGFFIKNWNKITDQEINRNNWIEKTPKKSRNQFIVTYLILAFISILFIDYNTVLSILSSIAFIILGFLGAFGMTKMSYDCRLLKTRWEFWGEKVKYTKNLINADLDNNLLLQYSILVGLDNYQTKQILNSFDHDSGHFIWFDNGNMESFSNMIDTSVAIGAGFGGDGGAGGGGGGGGGGGSG